MASISLQMLALGNDSEFVVWIAHVPFKGNALTLGIAHNAGHVATKLGVIAWEENKPCKNTGAELFEQGPIAIVPIDLPVRRDGSKEHDARVGYWWLVNGDI
jgi:hypothetical protein